MKLRYEIGGIAAALAIMTSCSMHDPYGEVMKVGDALPTVSLELGSTVVTAGENVAFKGKYYTDGEHQPDHSEIWVLVSQSESAEATLKLTPTYAYTQSVNSTDTVRASQSVATYPHSDAEWNGHEFELNVEFPTSQTLRQLTWGNISEWDQEKFDSYYPENFQQDFVNTVVNSLTQDSTYYDDLRYVYVNYDFTTDQINGVIAKYPELNQNGELSQLVLTTVEEKSDIWYTKTTREEQVIDPETNRPHTEEVPNVVGKYYIELVNGVAVYREVPVDFVAPDGVQLYDVYESSPWLFCRYDDNVGGIVTTVRGNYMPVFKDLISLIPFTDWIYDSVEQQYAVSFSRKFQLGVTFKVFDTDGNIGYTTDPFTVYLN